MTLLQIFCVQSWYLTRLLFNLFFKSNIFTKKLNFKYLKKKKNINGGEKGVYKKLLL